MLKFLIFFKRKSWGTVSNTLAKSRYRVICLACNSSRRSDQEIKRSWTVDDIEFPNLNRFSYIISLVWLSMR